jgi:hypothetical protein
MWIKNPAGDLLNLATADLIGVQKAVGDLYALIARHGVYHADICARGTKKEMKAELAHIHLELTRDG